MGLLFLIDQNPSTWIFMDNNSIAVIIVNYNSGEHLRHCLHALGCQTRLPDRIIVVDNASRDGSAQRIQARFPSVEWIIQDSNTGFSRANNLAVQKAEGCPWVVLLNPDAFPAPDWLERLERTAGSFPEYVCFGSHMVVHGKPDTLDGTGDVYHISGLAWRRDHGAPSEPEPRQSGEVFSPCAAAAMYQRAAFLEAGGFDENFFTYFEDVDLGFRLRLMGHRCYYVCDAVVDHVGWGTTQRASAFSLYYGHRNLVWSFFKNMPWPLFWRFLPHHLLQNVFSIIWFTLQGKGGTIFRAKWNALAGLPRVWRQRKAIQKKNRVSMEDLLEVMDRNSIAPWMKIRMRARS